MPSSLGFSRFRKQSGWQPRWASQASVLIWAKLHGACLWSQRSGRWRLVDLCEFQASPVSAARPVSSKESVTCQWLSAFTLLTFPESLLTYALPPWRGMVCGMGWLIPNSGPQNSTFPKEMLINISVPQNSFDYLVSHWPSIQIFLD